MIAFEGISSVWTVALSGFLLGTILGCIATWFVSSRNRKTRELQTELNELKENFSDYREQVTQHFMQTSSLVQVMTENYRAVYEHLASGAQHLCNIDEGANRLQQTKTEDIDNPHAAGVISAEAGFDYDELEELSRIRNDIDQLMGESPHIADIDSTQEAEDKSPLQH